MPGKNRKPGHHIGLHQRRRRLPSSGRFRFGATLAALVVVSTVAAVPTYSLFSEPTRGTGSTIGAATTAASRSAPTISRPPSVPGRAGKSPTPAAPPAASRSSRPTRAASDKPTDTHRNGANELATFWKFDERTGSTTPDSSAAANDGTLLNAPTLAAGTAGNALNLNGTNQYVNGAHAAVDTSESFSVSAFVYLTDKVTYRTAVSQNGDHIPGFWLQYNIAADRWVFATADSDSTSATLRKATGARSPSLNRWYHLVGVHDRSAGTIKLYVNGSLQATTAFTRPWNATGVLAVGRAMWSGANGDFWPGKIDEVRLYQRALTATEITD